MVVVYELDFDAGHLSADNTAIGFDEVSALVAKNAWYDDLDLIESSFKNLHGAEQSVR